MLEVPGTHELNPSPATAVVAQGHELPAPAHGLKLLDYLWEALRSRHCVGYSDVQELFGHSDIKTTMIYTHVLNHGPAGVRSPADGL